MEAVHLSAASRQGYATDQLDMVREDDPQFVCGALLFEKQHSLHGLVYSNTALSCSSAVQAALYSMAPRLLDSERVSFSAALCAQCGVSEAGAEFLA